MGPFSKKPTSDHFLHTDQVGEGKSPVGDDTLHLLELGEMRGIHSFITEDSINAEKLRRSESILGLALGGGTRMRCQLVFS